MEASTVAEARVALDQTFDGAVIDRRLSDGDGLELVPTLAEAAGPLRILIHSDLDAGHGPAWVLHVPNMNVREVAALLGLTRSEPPADGDDAARARVRRAIPRIAAAWTVRRADDEALRPEVAERVGSRLASALGNAVASAHREPPFLLIADAADDEGPTLSTAISYLSDLRRAFVTAIATPPDDGLANVVSEASDAIDGAIEEFAARWENRLR